MRAFGRNPQFHVFFSQDKYEGPRYEGTRNEPEVLDLKATEADGKIFELTVIYGEKVSFEPIEVVTRFKIDKFI